MISQSFSEYISQFETDGSNLYGSSYIITEEEILPDFDTLSKVVTTVVGTYSTKQDYKDRNMIATSSANYSGEVGIFQQQNERIRVVTDTDRETRIEILNNIFVEINKLSIQNNKDSVTSSVTSISGTSQYNFKPRGTASGTTGRKFNNIIIEVKPLHAETSFTMKDYLGDSTEENYRYSNAKDLRKKIEKSLENEKLKSKVPHITKLFHAFDELKQDPKNVDAEKLKKFKELMQNKNLISFGEVFVPYLLLQREECPFINKLINIFPSQHIKEIKWPNASNNIIHDYTIVFENNKTLQVAYDQAKVENFKKNLKDYSFENLIKFVDKFVDSNQTEVNVSAKYGMGHKQDLTVILRYNFSKLKETNPEELEQYKNLTLYRFAEFLNNENEDFLKQNFPQYFTKNNDDSNGKNKSDGKTPKIPTYIKFIKFILNDENIIKGTFDREALFNDLVKYANGENPFLDEKGECKQEYKELIEKILDSNKEIGLISDSRGKIIKNFPDSITFFCGKALEYKIQHSENTKKSEENDTSDTNDISDTSEKNKQFLKLLIGCVDYVQVRINEEKNKNLFDILFVNKESDFEILTKILNGTNGIRNFKIGRGGCVGIGVVSKDEVDNTDKNNTDDNNDATDFDNDFDTNLRNAIEYIIQQKYEESYKKGMISDELIDSIVEYVKRTMQQATEQ